MPDNPPSNPNSPNAPNSPGDSNSPGKLNASGGANAPVAISTQDSPSTTATAPPAEAPHAPKPPKRRDDGPRKSHGWVWIVVILVLLLGGFYFYRQHVKAEDVAKTQAKQPRPGVPIQTVTARTGDIGVYINALGTVTPVYTATITSRVDGQITNVAYREGQMVRKGDLLIEIDPRPFQAALTQAQGTLAKDEAVLNEARIDLNRFQQAYDRNAIAKQQLDDQEQLVKQDEGTVKQDQGAVASAATNVDYTRITAPIEGRVGLRLVDPGNIVTSGATTPLVVVTQLQPITVIFSVAEDYLPQIQKQLRSGVKMAVDAFARDQATKLASGSLLTLDNVIDQTTGTLKLKAIFQNQDLELFPNQFVNARLLVDTQRSATLIPTAAIQRNAQGAFVYVIGSDNTATLRTITVGTTDVNTAAVQNVKAGEVIAVNGFDKLQNGAKVTINNNNGSGGTNTSGSNGTGANSNGQTPGSTTPSSTGGGSHP
ncbi:MAG TPA: efflux RND transporter periplasmic adaptor subunit [Candidatus Acidoferrales bacterium]|nr:efflux RND transporter periplasmic adaptor subunit [Candidatus Acidoferrales bacterium]